MAKSHYSNYCEHCLRFYSRHKNPVFASESDKLSWYACKNALDKFNPLDQELLLTVYREGDTIADSIYRISKDTGIKQGYIWSKIKNLEKYIATERGLI